MEKPNAVSVQNVTKSYRLFSSISERLKEVLHPFKKTYHKDFLALNNVSLEVKKGGTFGIIGRNGSGKSTLLQIICSVSQPTSGSVAVNGRISSLLSLGAGFNPEYTGRANVMFNGSLMGFTPAEMKDRLPLIQAFADIGDFFDQPVKTYSSGMYVRLAFASAINVDPDILIIDEALAVGDARFQQKCYQKFNDFKDAGKTIILVTHDTSAVLKHCDSAILLENGIAVESGHPKKVVDNYYKLLFGGTPASGYVNHTAQTQTHETAEKGAKTTAPKTDLDVFLEEMPSGDNCTKRKSYNKNETRYGNKKAEVVDYLVVCGSKFDPASVNGGDTIELYVKTLFHEDIHWPHFGYGIRTIDGIMLYATNTKYQGIKFPLIEKNTVHIFKFTLKMNLKAGDYFIAVGVAEDAPKFEMIDSRYDIVHLSVTQKNSFDGFVELESSCEEIKRINPEVSSS